MDRMAQTALNSLKMLMENQTATSHNLSNLSTPGYRQDVVTDFGSIYLNRQNGVEPRIVSARNVGGFSTQQGSMETTGNPLDVALDGNGYFLIEPRDGGKPALSRRGDLQTSETGELLDGAGNRLLDDGLQPIVLPAFRRIDISPNGEILAVSNEDDNELTIIDLNTKKILKSIQNVGIEPEGVNFSPDGKQVFVTSEGTNSVIVVDPWKQEIINEVLVGNRPRRGIFVNDGTEYWVSNELNGSVTIINTSNLNIIKTIYFSVKGIKDQDITPVDFAYSKNLNKVFVTLGSANHVAVVNSKTYAIENNILVGSRVWGAALTKDDKELIVTNGNSDDISIIDIKKLVAVLSVPVGKTPHTVRVLK